MTPEEITQVDLDQTPRTLITLDFKPNSKVRVFVSGEIPSPHPIGSLTKFHFDAQESKPYDLEFVLENVQQLNIEKATTCLKIAQRFLADQPDKMEALASLLMLVPAPYVERMSEEPQFPEVFIPESVLVAIEKSGDSTKAS